MTVHKLVEQGYTPEQIRGVALDMEKKGKSLWGWAEYEHQHFPQKRHKVKTAEVHAKPPVVSLRDRVAPPAPWVKAMHVHGLPETYVELCMHYLAPKQQKTLYWHYCGEWTYAEIAWVFGCHPSVVESIESSAREELMDIYPIIRRMKEADDAGVAV